MKKANLYEPKIKKKKIRKSGILKGKIIIEKDFDQLPEDFMEYFK